MRMSRKEWKEGRQSGGGGAAAKVVEGEVGNRMTRWSSLERVVITVLEVHASSVVMLVVVTHLAP